MTATVEPKIDYSQPGSAQRNAEPILAVLEPLLKQSSYVVEVASGFGYHVGLFAKRYPTVTFQPAERDQQLVDAITQETKDLSNVLKPVQLDITNPQDWSRIPRDSPVSGCIVLNLTHITPWTTTLALLQNVASLDPKWIIFYGAFITDGPLSEGNKAFNEDLKQRNNEFGLRKVDDLTCAVVSHLNGFVLQKIHNMPKGNLLLEYSASN